jgi:hypothetical protein
MIKPMWEDYIVRTVGIRQVKNEQKWLVSSSSLGLVIHSMKGSTKAVYINAQMIQQGTIE